jgi:hypothetical protein
VSRYYFKIVDGSQFTDSEGQELPDDDAAWQQALQTVRDVEATLTLGGTWSIEVRRERKPILRIDVSAQRIEF